MAEGEETDGTVLVTMLREMMGDQQCLMTEQQETQWRMLMDIIEQQREEMARHHKEMRDLLARTETSAGKETMKVSLPKPTMQKLGSDDDIEHFLEMFEDMAKQRE